MQKNMMYMERWKLQAKRKTYDRVYMQIVKRY